jgi:O-methyltransferase involved in polyketide biosynthesis
MLVATRPGTVFDTDGSGLPQLRVRGLDAPATRTLLRAAHGALPAPVAQLIADSSEGNPLALLEVPRLLTESQLAGHQAIAEPLPVGPTLERALLARHRIIDALLAEAIEQGRVAQVIEVACGMSPRGWRFAQRFGDRITYLETDLPAMADRKRRALQRMGAPNEHHRVAEVDALRDDGPRSLAAVASTLDRRRGLAIVSEGLLSYFDDGAVRGMWRRFAGCLTRFRSGLYVADLHLGGSDQGVVARGFGAALSSLVGRRVGAHFEGERAAAGELRAAGFAEAHLHRADGNSAAGDAGRDPAAARVHIVEATV